MIASVIRHCTQSFGSCIANLTRQTFVEPLSSEQFSRTSGKTCCHGDLVPVAVEMLMKALLPWPRRDQRHPGREVPRGQARLCVRGHRETSLA